MGSSSHKEAKTKGRIQARTALGLYFKAPSLFRKDQFIFAPFKFDCKYSVVNIYS